MSTILVTGGAGFIGGCLVKRLLRRGDTVVNLDALTYAGNLDSLESALDHPRHHFEHGWIEDTVLTRRLFEAYAPDTVFHLAAESHVDRSIDDTAPFLRTNVVGTLCLLDVALEYWTRLSGGRADRFRFVHVSTDEVFGTLGPTGTFTETSGYAPNSPYAASKAAADHFARAYHRTYGLPVVTTNCCNNFGPYQFPEKLIPLMVLNARDGKDLPVYGDGGHVRDWLFVEDHVDALLCVLERGRIGQTYNIGARAEYTNLEVVHAICALVDELCPALPHRPCLDLVKLVDDRPGHDRRYAIDPTKIMEELAWRPAHSFQSALRETVQWYLENADWTERVLSGGYRRERLGLPSKASGSSARTQSA